MTGVGRGDVGMSCFVWLLGCLLGLVVMLFLFGFGIDELIFMIHRE